MGEHGKDAFDCCLYCEHYAKLGPRNGICQLAFEDRYLESALGLTADKGVDLRVAAKQFLYRVINDTAVSWHDEPCDRYAEA